jgi:hypothetical protein
VTSAGSGESGSTGGLVCDDYISEVGIGPSATMTIRNDSALPVFFSPLGCTWQAPILLSHGPTGEFVAYVSDPCSVSCEEFMVNDACWAECPDCAAPPLVRLSPGGTWIETWSGVSMRATSLPVECAAADDCEPSCFVAEQATDDFYFAQLGVYETCEGDCTCDEPTAEGACYIYQSLGLSDMVQLEQVFTYPTQTSVTLTYG